MSKKIDLTGRIFNRLKVISEADKDKHGNIRWACQCECGKSTIVVGDNLRRGLSKSCGCLRRELSKKQFTTHGMARTPTYQTWCHMLNRCRNKKDKGYCNYGGRGILVCDRWLKFERFIEDMGVMPDGLTIERLCNDGNYEPSNCKWGTRIEQARNRRIRKTNKSGATGVWWHKESKKWQVRIGYNGRNHHIGLYPGLEQAIEERRNAELKYW